MAYYFMLDTFPLPIPPSALTIKTPSMNKTVTLINDGEINIPKNQGLREISFEFLIPAVQKYPFATYHLGMLNASAWILLLKYAKSEAIPFPFTVARMTPGGQFNYFTSIVVLIEDVEFKENASEYGLDTMCSITLKEYKPYGTKRVKLKEATNAKPGTKQAKVTNIRDSSSHVKKSTVTTQKNETVVSAAKRNGDDLVDLSKRNNINITSWDSVDATSKSLDIKGVDFSKYEQSTFGGLDSSGNVVLEPGVASTPVKSMGDTILIGNAATKYTSPTPPTPNVFEKLTEQGINWGALSGGI